MIAWGNALIASRRTHPTRTMRLGVVIRNTGIELKTFETASYYEYYLNANNDTFPPMTTVSYGGKTYGAAGYVQVASYTANPTSPAAWKPEIYASDQFVMQRGTTTFFVSNDPTTGNNAEGHYAITILPFSPSSLYLGSRPEPGRDELQQLHRAAEFGLRKPGRRARLRNLPIQYPAETYVYQASSIPPAPSTAGTGSAAIGTTSPRARLPRRLAQDNYSTYAFQATLDTPGLNLLLLAVLQQVRRGRRQCPRAERDRDGRDGHGRPRGDATTSRTYIVENLLSTPLAAVDFSDGYTVAERPGPCGLRLDRGTEHRRPARSCRR